MLTAVIALIVGLASSASVRGQTASLVHVIEGTTTGEVIAIRSGAIAVRQNAAESAVPLASVREITFAPVDRPDLPPPFTVWGVNAGCMGARSVSASTAPGALDLTGYGWAAEDLPLDQIRAIGTRRMMQDATASAAFDRALAAGSKAKDALIAMTDAGVRTVSCVVTGVSMEGVHALVGGAERTAGWDRCGGIVLASVGAEVDPGSLHEVALTDGSRILCKSFELGDGVLTAQRQQGRFTVEAGRVARIRVASDSYCYVSDLRPAVVKAEPQLDVILPHRMDYCVSGGPLVLDGTTYDKGIGMQPLTTLTFENSDSYDRFLAVVGVDDAAGGRGSVKFAVLCDGKVATEVGPVSGADGPQRLDVDIAGARQVTLSAEPGAPLVLSGNFADWCDARFVNTRKAAFPAAPEGDGEQR